MLKRSFTTLLFILTTHLLIAEEGMFPISDIHKLNLKKIGLKIDAKDLYNPDGVSIVNAVVRIGGCTGSFISPDGLILTNHHCVIGAVAVSSSKEQDYVTDGFIAKTRAEELPAKGQTVRLIESFTDVTNRVLSAVNSSMEPIERAKAIERKIREIVEETEKNNSAHRAEVAEMLPGKKYVLFVYFTIKDVRLVYVPPRSIGEFGGEDDNWTWPRHTGDFSFVRAYVAPDGSTAEYSVDNIPYRPKKYLKINPAGVDENDVVFILGFPGRTFRHRTSHFLEYDEKIRLPFIAEWNEFQTEIMRKAGKDDRAVSLKFDARVKSLANVSKNFRGKIQGMTRLQLVDKKREEEKLLQEFINASSERKEKYSTLIDDIGAVYHEMMSAGISELLLDALRTSSIPLANAITLYEASLEIQKPDSLRSAAYTENNRKVTYTSLQQSLKNYYEPVDKILLKKLLAIAGSLPAKNRIAVLDSIVENDYSEQTLNRFLETKYSSTILTESKLLENCDSLIQTIQNNPTDAFINIAKALHPTYIRLRETRLRREGMLNKLLPLYVDVKQEFMKRDFIPDANSTMRFTYGRIKGYSPADATYYSPITTLRGIMEKTRNAEPYNTPMKIRDLYKKKDFSRYKHKKLDDVPVAILYDMDTTGGNSGSAVMNAKGELVGINFDRAYEATINDYAWSEAYSRSIAVDIRYVLWLLEKFAGADWLLEGMKVK